MKGLAPILVLAIIMGAVLLMTLTGKTLTHTSVRVLACSADAVIPAVEGALVETDFHVIQSKTPGDGGTEGSLVAENRAGSEMSLLFDELPQGGVTVQITVSGDSRNEAEMALLDNRLQNALQRLDGARVPR